MYLLGDDRLRTMRITAFNHLFLLRFFGFFLPLLLLFETPSNAERFFPHFYKNRKYTFAGGPHALCDEKGLEKLIELRKKQLEESGVILSSDPIPTQGCVRTPAKVTVIISDVAAEKYSLPFMKNIENAHPEGIYPCSWDPDRRCLEPYDGPMKKYLEIGFLDNFLSKDGKWYKGFIEIDGDFKILDHPDNVEDINEAGEGRRTPNTASLPQKYQVEFLLALEQELRNALDRINKEVDTESGSVLVQKTYPEEEITKKHREVSSSNPKKTKERSKPGK